MVKTADSTLTHFLTDPTTAAARKSARNAQKLAEQEEAEIISSELNVTSPRM